MRVLGFVALGLGILFQGLFLLLGILIPFTIGVSAVLLPVPILGYLIATLIALLVRTRLVPGDPLRARLSGMLLVTRLGGRVGVIVVVVMIICITIGIALGLSGFARRGGPKRQVRAAIDLHDLRPNSLADDGHFIGMQHFVVHIARNGRIRWLERR